MSASDTALSADLKHLEVISASVFNTPMSRTPIPTITLSSETVSLLDEVANRLKDPALKKGKGLKRKRLESQATSTDTRGIIQLQSNLSKTLYRKKLNLATNIHSIRNSLKTGTCPVQCNFRSTPPVSADEDFKKMWIELTAKCKRGLTLLWVEELNRKYSSVKLEIQSTLAEIESHLDQKQFKEIKDSLNSKFHTAAPVSLEKKLRTSYQQRPPQMIRANLSKAPEPGQTTQDVAQWTH